MEIDAYVSRHGLPSSTKLLTKLVRDDASCPSFDEALAKHDGNPDIFKQYSPDNGDTIQRDGRSAGAVMVGAWAHRVQSGAISINDMYIHRHTVYVPGDALDLTRASRTEVVRYGTEEIKIITNKFAAYHLFGIPEEEWMAWEACGDVGGRPDFIYRYRVLAQQYGVEINPRRYWAYYRSLEDFHKLPVGNDYYGKPETADKVSLAQMTEYLRVTAAIEKAGSSDDIITDLAAWVADDWNWEAIKNLGGAGIKHVEAKRLWDDGLQDSKLIVKHLVGGVPLDWAQQLHEARKSAS